MKYLNQQATIGDVIALMIAVPAITTGIFGCPCLLGIIPKFEKMFMSLNAKLPFITTFIMNNYTWVYTVVPWTYSIGLAYYLYKSNNNNLKVIFSTICFILNFSLIQMAVYGIFSPILELQKQLQ